MTDASHARAPGLTGPDTAPTSAGSDAHDPREPISKLRGAGAQVDVRRTGRVAVVVVLLVLGVLGVVLLVAGVNKNNQTNELRNQGVPVTFTVSSCQGLLGGSGSNAAGYACRGSYRLRGRVYTEALPGTTFYAPGATVSAVAVPTDPGLVSPVRIVQQEHSTATVFIVPAVLLSLFVILSAVALVRWRRHRPPSGRADAQVGGV